MSFEAPLRGFVMRIEEAQEMMRRIYLERDRACGLHGTLNRTIEEMEELTEALLEDYSSEAVEEEMADVFAWLCSLANLMEVDITSAFFTKYTDVCSKCKQSPCVCPE
jgi:NTP pyrophosphatase (non-canonical NTP hydrolase)